MQVRMINPKNPLSSQKYQIETYPEAKELAGIIENVRKNHGIKHIYEWKNKDDFLFTFSILCSDQEGPLEWWFHRFSEARNEKKTLWYYKTDDYAVIYTQLLLAVGAPNPLEEVARSEKELKEQYIYQEEGKPRAKRSLGASLLQKKKTETIEQPLSIDENPGEMSSNTREKERNIAQPYSFLSGNLKSRPIAALLRSIARDELTGHLSIEGAWGWTTIQFGLGEPVHAASEAYLGREAVLELFVKDEGEIDFEEGLQPESATVQDSLDQLINAGLQYSDGMQFLRSHGIDEHSFLQRSRTRLNEEQVATRLLQGLNLGLPVQQEFYSNVYGTLSLGEVADKMSLTSSRWVPIVCNLLKLGLLIGPEGAALTADIATMPDSSTSRVEMPSPGESSVPVPFSGGFAPSKHAREENNLESEVSGITSSTNSNNNNAWNANSSAGSEREIREKTLLMPPSFVFGATANSAAPANLNETNLKGSNDEGANHGNKTVENLSLSGTAGAALSAGTFDLDISSGGAPMAATSAIGNTFDRDEKNKALLSLSAVSSPDLHKLLTEKTFGIYSQELMSFFLEREFARAYRFKTAFTLLCFTFYTGMNSGIDLDSLKEIISQIDKTKRDVDTFGMGGRSIFALIMPQIQSRQSLAFVERLDSLFFEAPETAKKTWLNIRFAAASVPEDAQDISILLGSIEKALAVSIKSTNRMIISGELR